MDNLFARLHPSPDLPKGHWLALGVFAILTLNGCGGAGKPKVAAVGLIDKSSIDVDERLQELFAQGIGWMKQEQFEKAKAIMLRIIAEDERLPGPVTNLGIIHLKLNDPENAIKYLTQATTMDPTQSAAFNTLAVIYREEGEFEKAKKMYLEAIKYNPDYLLSYYNLGVLCDIYLRQPQCAYDNFIIYNNNVNPKDPLVENWIDELESR